MDGFALQRALIAKGYDPGPVDGDVGPLTTAAVRAFQREQEIFEGIVGPLTTSALAAPRSPTPAAPAAPPVRPPASEPTAGYIPAEWMPGAVIAGVVVHWTGGAYEPNDDDARHYHFLLTGSLKLVRGIPSIKANSLPRVRPGYAAHTKNCNSGYIGVTACAMHLATPKNFGRVPLTRGQWEALPPYLATLSRRYGFPITPRTLLTHAEVQATLKKPQDGKWDIAVLPFDAAAMNTATKVGDALRAAVSALL